MEGHDWWHLLVLGTTLLGAAGLVLVVAIPLIFEDPPQGWARTRSIVLVLVGTAAALLIAEWLGVH